MTKWWKFSLFQTLVLFGIIAVYFSLRLPNLTLQPIFADEAIYIRWAQVMRSEPTLRFLPLSDGKTPLFMWILGGIFKYFSDPLLAGRFLSVVSGFVTLLGVIFLGAKFFNQKVALWAGILVAIVPFSLFFDRMALVDSMLTAFSVWCLCLSLLLIDYPRIDLAMVLGYFLGAGLLTKPPGFFSALSLPSTLVIFDWKGHNRQPRLVRIAGLWLVSLIIMLAIYNILRLGPGFSSLNSRNQDYVFSPLELRNRWLDPFIPHLHDLIDWFPKLFTLPVVVLALAGSGFVVFSRNRPGLAILGWLLIPLVIQMFFLKTFTARYILTSIPPLLLLAGLALDRITKIVPNRTFIISTLLLILISVLPLYSDYLLLADLAKANLPRSERRGYLEDWTAGYGLKEIAGFLNLQSQKGLVVVGTEGSFGTLPDGLQIYLDNNRQVVVIGGTGTISAQIRNSANEHPTYYVANRSQYAISAGLKLIKTYPKIIGPEFPQDSIELFQVLPGLTIK